MSAAVIRYSWHSTPRVLRACAGGGDMAAHAPDDPMLVSGGGGNAVCDAALDDFPSSVLAALPDVGSSPSAAFARLQPEAGAPQSAVALRVAPAGEPVTPLPAEQDFLSSLYAAPGFLPDITALAEKLDSAARTAVARALEGAESLAFDGEEFSRFRQAQPAQPTTAHARTMSGGVPLGESAFTRRHGQSVPTFNLMVEVDDDSVREDEPGVVATPRPCKSRRTGA